MRVAFACDHAGWILRERVVGVLQSLAHELVDCGSAVLTPGDDYPDRAASVASAIVGKRADRGLLVCGSGVGASIAANKFRGIRACLCHDTFSARQGVEDDDMNVLCLGARIVGEELAADVVHAFLGANFSDADRHVRRVKKILEFEQRWSG